MKNDWTDANRIADYSSILAISVALCLAIFAGFLAGVNVTEAGSFAAGICDKGWSLSDCIALRAANAAEEATRFSIWLVWISAGSLLASSAALFGLFSTYRQGLASLAEAKKATQISDKNAQAQVRAYVVLQSVDVKLSPEINGGFSLRTRLKFANSGLSPALRLKYSVVVRIGFLGSDYELIQKEIGQDFDPNRSHWQQDIAAGQDWTQVELHSVARQGDELVHSIKTSIMIVLTVKVNLLYEDVFGVTHRGYVCFQGEVDQDDEEFSALERGPDDIFDKHLLAHE